MRHLACALAALIIAVSTALPASAEQVVPPLEAGRANAALVSSIAPGVDRTHGGFGDASVIVPAGTYVTFRADTDAALAGATVVIWTRNRDTDWSPRTTRLVDAAGVVRYFAQVHRWTAFRATIAAGGDHPALASHGRIANISRTSFALEVLPPQLPTANRNAIGGQRYVFLVRLYDAHPADGPVSLSVTAPGALSATVTPSVIRRGMIAEVTIVPPAVAAETSLRVRILGQRMSGAGVAADWRTIPLLPGTDSEASAARERLVPFLSWLAEHEPDLGLTTATPLVGTSASHLLVVTHYLFVGDEWEIGLAWHVMIPPDDWARIYLRHRWSDAWPTRAFEIRSVAGNSKPVEIAPPPAVTR